ncbi:hypothetical protein [Halospeciosus flavus]|uniref:Integral membrane protein n=1 Tax=Halospeciosus flavus TaxID=3032283 RepID=A0ABD5Z1W6_9EURY|nr:hypothetical protein [Halospeciosus flavus]
MVAHAAPPSGPARDRWDVVVASVTIAVLSGFVGVAAGVLLDGRGASTVALFAGWALVGGLPAFLALQYGFLGPVGSPVGLALFVLHGGVPLGVAPASAFAVVGIVFAGVEVCLRPRWTARETPAVVPGGRGDSQRP